MLEISGTQGHRVAQLYQSQNIVKMNGYIDVPLSSELSRFCCLLCTDVLYRVVAFTGDEYESNFLLLHHLSIYDL